MGLGNYLQGGGKDVVDLRYQELGSDGCDAEGDGGVPQYSGLADFKDDISSSQGWGMVVVIFDRGLGYGLYMAK